MTDFDFPLTGPITLSCQLGRGSLTINAEPGRSTAQVQATACRAGSDVLQRSRIELQGDTLVVRVPNQESRLGLGAVFGQANSKDEVDLVISLPAASPMQIRVGSADISLHGRSGNLDLGTGSSDITIDQVDGELNVRTGSGDLRLAEVTGAARIRSGSGEVRIGGAGGDLTASLGSGRFAVGTVRGAVALKSGSGSAELGSVERDVDLVSGSGSITVGLAAGVQARLDARTGSGQVHTEMPLASAPSQDRPAIAVRARTGSGNITVHRAAAVAS